MPTNISDIFRPIITFSVLLKSSLYKTLLTWKHIFTVLTKIFLGLNKSKTVILFSELLTFSSLLRSISLKSASLSRWCGICFLLVFAASSITFLASSILPLDNNHLTDSGTNQYRPNNTEICIFNEWNDFVRVMLSS